MHFVNWCEIKKNSIEKLFEIDSIINAMSKIFSD